MPKKYRTCPCCHSLDAISVKDLSVYTSCTKCNEDIEINPHFSVALSALLLIICLILIERGHLILSALVLVIMAVRSARLVFFDAFEGFERLKSVLQNLICLFMAFIALYCTIIRPCFDKHRIFLNLIA